MKKIMDEDRALAFAQEQPIAVVEMLINLMNGVVRRRKAAEKGSPAVIGALPGTSSSTRPRKSRAGQVQVPSNAALPPSPTVTDSSSEIPTTSPGDAQSQSLNFTKV